MHTTVIPTALKLFRFGQASDQSEVMNYFAALAMYEYPLPPEVPVAILESISQLEKAAVAQIVDPFTVIFLNTPECDT
jgi:hypothetical protein